MPLTSFLRAIGLALLAPLAVACVVQTDPGSGHRGDVMTAAGGPAPAPPAAGGSGNDSSGAASATPILVDIDTNQTMTAAPGQGVGVFTEYTAGGHWHVWWTCDTSVNPAQTSCAFDVKISVASGAITNTKPQLLEATDTFNTSAKQLEAQTTTSTGVDGLLFDTDPGAVITLEATVGGLHDSRFLFFVQDRKVNGGFNGTLTDPIMLEGTSP